MKYTMKIMKFDFRTFFKEVLRYTKNNDQHWSVHEIIWYSKSVNLGFTREELEEIWKSWDEGKKKYLNFSELCHGTGISKDFNVEDLAK